MFEDDYESESDIEQAGLSEQAQRQLVKEQRLIEDLETDAAEHPFEEDTEEKDPERKKLRRELHDVQKDTKKAACRPYGQGGKAAADDLAGKRIFKRVRTNS